MRITGLRLRDFRGYQQVMLTPPEGVTMLVGENGAGKTNLLEAVHLCCVGRSHRTAQDKEMIRKGQETAAVQLTVEKNDGRHEVGVRLFENARKRKVVFVNGKTAEKYYRRLLEPVYHREAVCLPSTSPANAAKSLADLIAQWRVLLDYLTGQ